MTHPHPRLPLEGEGVFDSLASVAPVHLLSCICSLPFKGRAGVGMGQVALALPGEAAVVNVVNVVTIVTR